MSKLELKPEDYNPSQRIPYQWIVWEGNDTIRELYGNEWPDAVVRAFNRLYQRLSHQDMQAKYGIKEPKDKGGGRVNESKKPKKLLKCEDCFERKADVKMRDYEDAEIPLCEECFFQNTGHGQSSPIKEPKDDR